jgi:hypothetical protein
MENLPEDGPFILTLTEQSAFGMLGTAWVSFVVMNRLRKKGKKPQVYLQSELWRYRYFRIGLKEANTNEEAGKWRPLSPVAEGNAVVTLLEGLQNLRNGGFVTINPEGDATWDGRPVAMRDSLAWLALHSGAPIVPAIISMTPGPAGAPGPIWAAR